MTRPVRNGLADQVQRSAQRLEAEGRIARNIRTQPGEPFKREPGDILIARTDGDGVHRSRETALEVARRRDVQGQRREVVRVSEGPVMLTLASLHRLALRWCPVPARWDRIIAHPRAEWGSAHEIAHALLSTPEERTRADYGLCSIGHCYCGGDRCGVVEIAAMAISAKLHLACGRRELIAVEEGATDDYVYIATRWHRTRAARLLARRGLTRIPRTRAGLERLLRRRLA